METNEYENPWGLTPSEVRSMDAMIKHGCSRLAAKATGRSHLTIRNQTARAGLKIGFPSDHLTKYLLWDRFRQKQLNERKTS